VRLSTADLSTLTGLLICHAHLNRHMTLVQIQTDAVCSLCQEDEETVLHLLGQCKARFFEAITRKVSPELLGFRFFPSQFLIFRLLVLCATLSWPPITF